jgi:hypothetical protein
MARFTGVAILVHGGGIRAKGLFGCRPSRGVPPVFPGPIFLGPNYPGLTNPAIWKATRRSFCVLSAFRPGRAIHDPGGGERNPRVFDSALATGGGDLGQRSRSPSSGDRRRARTGASPPPVRLPSLPSPLSPLPSPLSGGSPSPRSLAATMAMIWGGLMALGICGGTRSPSVPYL